MGALCALWVVGSAVAHEVRPAMLDIRQSGAAEYLILWKRPIAGDRGIHLVPRLSTGWLDQPSGDRYSDGSFLIESWRIAGADAYALDHATFSVEGARGTLVDVFVRATFQDGRQIETLVNADTPEYRFMASGSARTGRWWFLKSGIQHILEGPDHLLFVLGLILIAKRGWPLVKAISGFTLAHSLTLGIATLWRLDLPMATLNMLVALSIVFLAHELIRDRAGHSSISQRFPMIPALAFGLLHGLAFATGLFSVGLDNAALLAALLTFNLGVEVGQLVFVGTVLLLLQAVRLLPVRWPLNAELLPTYFLGIAGSVWLFRYSIAVLESQR
jgi:hypothetical protein